MSITYSSKCARFFLVATGRHRWRRQAWSCRGGHCSGVGHPSLTGATTVFQHRAFPWEVSEQLCFAEGFTWENISARYLLCKGPPFLGLRTACAASPDRGVSFPCAQCPIKNNRPIYGHLGSNFEDYSRVSRGSCRHPFLGALAVAILAQAFGLFGYGGLEVSPRVSGEAFLGFPGVSQRARVGAAQEFLWRAQGLAEKRS